MILVDLRPGTVKATRVAPESRGVGFGLRVRVRPTSLARSNAEANDGDGVFVTPPALLTTGLPPPPLLRSSVPLRTHNTSESENANRPRSS
jgi:hypothetical protein